MHGLAARVKLWGGRKNTSNSSCRGRKCPQVMRWGSRHLNRTGWRSAARWLVALSFWMGFEGCSSSTGPGSCSPYNPIGSLDIGPTWSPRADLVAYVHGLRNAADSSGIYVAPSSGGTPRKIANWTHPVAPELAWSPDGSQIAMYIGDIWTIQIADRSLRRWTSVAPYAHYPSWSPDGRYLLYVVIARSQGEPDSASGLHVIDTADGSIRAMLHDGQPTYCGRASWSPDGATIAFVTAAAGQQTGDVYTMRSDGSNYMRLTRMEGIAGNPQWSLDGRTILFDFTPAPCLPENSGDRITYAINADGTGLRRWPVNLGDPRVTFAFPFELSRAVSRVAFVGLDSGRKRGVIWTMNLDGSDRRQITMP